MFYSIGSSQLLVRLKIIKLEEVCFSIYALLLYFWSSILLVLGLVLYLYSYYYVSCQILLFFGFIIFNLLYFLADTFLL